MLGLKWNSQKLNISVNSESELEGKCVEGEDDNGGGRRRLGEKR